MSLLRVEALDCRYGLFQAVRGVSLEVAEGETVALIGANGAGKTTLLRAVAGAHRPAGGQVWLDGVDITRVPAHRRVALGGENGASGTAKLILPAGCSPVNGGAVVRWVVR